jgi:hypothetical protein
MVEKIRRAVIGVIDRQKMLRERASLGMGLA